MKKALLITLGHNSSAIFVDDNGYVIGYEQERLDGIKASSRFPSDAINEIVKNVGAKRLYTSRVYISHWFDSCVTPYHNKYMSQIDYDNLVQLIGSTDIRFVNKDFTHHDAHAYSGFAFYSFHENEEQKKLRADKPLFTIVADGFGTDKEVLSIYELHKNTQKLVHRHTGYSASLGLMYQYATAFCGMKMNQDEYKFLGYEPFAPELLTDEQMHELRIQVKDVTNSLVEMLTSENVPYTPNDPLKLIDFSELDRVKKDWFETFATVLSYLGYVGKQQDLVGRAVIGYFIQQVIEEVMIRILKLFHIQNCIVVGGIFYNVKLNNRILNFVNGTFSAMPLAGDQGAAIGMYVQHNLTGFINFRSLSIGERSLDGIEKFSIKNMMVFTDRGSAISKIVSLLAEDNIVNVVNGPMEFGPRALCNTSTLFLPTYENVSANNTMNNRNDVMPCAPVIKSENTKLLFDDNELARVVGSDKFMICTHDYKLPDVYTSALSSAIVDLFTALYGGVAHRKTGHKNVFTGRPQIVEKNSLIWEVLTELEKKENIKNNKCIVNTSFNAHGRPIVFDTMDIIHNFNYQYEHAAGDKKPYLIILK